MRRRPPPAAPIPPRLIRRAVRADGSARLLLRRDAASPWVEVGDSRETGLDRLDRLQASCAHALVRSCLLDAALHADPSLFGDILQPRED